MREIRLSGSMRGGELFARYRDGQLPAYSTTAISENAHGPPSFLTIEQEDRKGREGSQRFSSRSSRPSCFGCCGI